MARKFERIGKAFEAIGHAVETKYTYSHPAIKLAVSMRNVAIFGAILVGIIVPLLRFEPIMLLVIALALATISVAISAMHGRTIALMVLLAFLALLLLGLTFIAYASLAKYA